MSQRNKKSNARIISAPSIRKTPIQTHALSISCDSDEMRRLRHYAAEARVSLDEFVIQGLDRRLAEFGVAPFRRLIEVSVR